MMRHTRLVLAAAASAMALASCQAFVNTEPLAGIGAACRKDTDCQASECVDGVCAIECDPEANDCPEGTICSKANLCQLEMRVAALYPGGTGQDWTLAHDQGFQGAVDPLPYLTLVDPKSNVASADDAAAQAAAAVSQGFNAIFAANPDWNQAITDLAVANPAVQFFTAGGGGGPGNHHGYFARLYKAWYLAGAAAARVDPAPTRMGIVGARVTPSVIRHINAFVRGARSVDPAIVAEVQWMNEWFDSSSGGDDSDVTLTTALLDNGATLIAYHGYNRFAGLAALTDPRAPWVIGNNLLRVKPEDPPWCNAPKCVGTVYWNWAPLYARLIGEAHSASLGPGAGANDNIQVDAAASVPNFHVNLPQLQEANDDLLGQLAQDGGGVGIPFAGPFCFTDASQPCVEEGQTLTDGDLGSMCRFVEGVVTRVGADDVPAEVPDEGDCKLPEE